MTLSRDRLWLPTMTWLGTALRFHGLFANRFHADEALFATWARLIAVWRDPLLLTQAVDKPPLLFYLQALFYPLFGPVEWAARMPNLIASVLLIPATGVLARRLYGDRVVALVAASVVAVAPLAVQFSATAFSDPLLTFWLVAAMLMAVRPDATPGRFSPATAGVCFGLALATKYQALLFLPVIVGIAWLTSWQRRDWLRGLAGFGVVLAVLLAWQVARSSTTAALALQWANIGGVRPAWSWELVPRLSRQAALWRISLSWPLAITGALLSLSVGVLAVTRRVRLLPTDALLTLFVAGYLSLHWLWAVPVWDRYLLPILPLVAVLLGRAFALVTARPEITLREERPAFLMLTLIIVATLVPGLAARAGSFPIGGRPDADGGAARVAALLADAPYGTVLYDHWYSWHWRYQLFDRRVYVSWFPHGDALLEDLAVFGDGDTPRYIALPVSTLGLPVMRQLEAAGYGLEMVAPSDGQMALFRIEPRTQSTP